MRNIEIPVDYIKSEICQGHSVIVHCQGRRGQSAAVIFALLMKAIKYDTQLKIQTAMSIARPKACEFLYM